MPEWNPKRFEEEQLLRGVLASVSLSHPPSCDCTTCRAASGDEAAFVEALADRRLLNAEELSLEGAAGESRVP